MQARQDEFCGLLSNDGPFKRAIASAGKSIDLNGFLESCIYDKCEFPDNELIHCETLEEVAYVLSQHQITVDSGWREITNCRM